MKSYGRRAVVRGVEFEVKPGEAVGSFWGRMEPVKPPAFI